MRKLKTSQSIHPSSVHPSISGINRFVQIVICERKGFFLFLSQAATSKSCTFRTKESKQKKSSCSSWTAYLEFNYKSKLKKASDYGEIRQERCALYVQRSPFVEIPMRLGVPTGPRGGTHRDRGSNVPTPRYHRYRVTQAGSYLHTYQQCAFCNQLYTRQLRVTCFLMSNRPTRYWLPFCTFEEDFSLRKTI